MLREFFFSDRGRRCTTARREGRRVESQRWCSACSTCIRFRHPWSLSHRSVYGAEHFFSTPLQSECWPREVPTDSTLSRKLCGLSCVRIPDATVRSSRSQAAEKAKPPLGETLKVAAWKATGGGLAGAAAMFVNVGTLMYALRPLTTSEPHLCPRWRILLATAFAVCTPCSARVYRALASFPDIFTLFTLAPDPVCLPLACT